MTNSKSEPLSFSKEEHEAHNRYLEEVLERNLGGFNYKKLDAERKLTYRVLEDYLESELALCGFLSLRNSAWELPRLPEARLPLLLSEYHFYTKRDIENYFAYLETRKPPSGTSLLLKKKKPPTGSE